MAPVSKKLAVHFQRSLIEIVPVRWSERQRTLPAKARSLLWRLAPALRPKSDARPS